MLWISAAAVVVAVFAQAAPSAPPAFVSMLARDSLAGWLADDATHDRVAVADGVLSIADGAGWVRTARHDYGDFRLKFDVRASATTSRALLALFGSSPGLHRSEVRGPQSPGSALVIPLLGVDTPVPARLGNMHLQLLTPSRSGVRGAIQADREWQSYEIVRRGAALTVLLNGAQVLMDRGPRTQDGWIGFLVDRGSLSIRALQLAEAPPASPFAYGAYRPGDGITLPVLLKEVRPNYTREALAAKIQGVVVLECVVDVDGTVARCDVVRSLDDRLGLDEEAMKAGRAWRFRPGTKDGQPVRVLVSIELTFTLTK